MTRLAVTRISKTYPTGTKALVDVSFALESGEAVAVIGPSGAGKTTLFRVLSRNTPLDSGSVQYEGTDLYHASYLHLADLRRRIGIVFQQHNLVAELSVLHNVLIGHLGTWSSWSSLKSLLFGPSPELLRAANSALTSVSLEDKAAAKAADLSGGEQQRVAIARLLIQDPDVVLADEPVASVDPISAQMIMDSFHELARRGKTVICNLHDVTLARANFGRILALKSGRLVFDEPSHDLDEEKLLDIYGQTDWARDTSERRLSPDRKSEETQEEEACTCQERAVRRILQHN